MVERSYLLLVELVVLVVEFQVLVPGTSAGLPW